MQELWKIYHHEIPEFLLEFIEIEEMQRLKDIGMNCGVEYTSFPLFQNCRYYSRYDHSVGVALIVWHFTGDMKQTIAGLLHDIATPVFAHTIDFLNNDHLLQQSTENETENMIRQSFQLKKLLDKYHLSYDDVSDYHRYPLADNEMPQLSADRLEYSLGNMYNYEFVSLEEIKHYYDHIYVNDAKDELVFNDLLSAADFTRHVFENSYVYISDEDRWAMETLAQILKAALQEGIIKKADLYTTEKKIIAQLKSHQYYKLLWQRYCQSHQIERCQEGMYIEAKKRYIMPKYHDITIDQLDDSIARLCQDFLAVSFAYGLRSK